MAGEASSDGRQDLLLRALERLGGQADASPRELVAAALAAGRDGDHRLAWLLADRLVRLDGGRRAASLLLRASALNRLGAAELAQDDIVRACTAEPDDPLAVQAAMTTGSAAQRRSAALRCAALPSPAGDLAVRTLAETGDDDLVLLSADDRHIQIDLHARRPGQRVLLWTDGEGDGSITVDASRDASTPFGCLGRSRIDWPGSAAVFAVRCEGATVLPSPLRRAPSGPVAQRPDTAFPGLAADRPSRLLIAVPVYDDAVATRACFDSLFRNRPTLPHRIVAIDDATPDPAIEALLDELSASGRIELIRNRVNLGFAASVNRILAARRADEDVLLLNADTVVPQGAIDRLAAVAFSAPDIGTVTPLSNNGEDTSFPLRFTANPLPSTVKIERLNSLAWAINAEAAVPMPNGVGFGLYLRRDAIERVGAFSTAYGRGYYEDVDYCLRAAQAGYRSVCATGVYLGHGGSKSFKAEKPALVRRNRPILHRAYPGYEAEADDFFRSDPLRAPIAAIERACLESSGGFDLILAPADLPLRWARRLASHLGCRSPVLASVATDGAKASIALRGIAGALPQTIDWLFDAAEPILPPDLLYAIARLPIASRIVVDGRRLPECAVSALTPPGLCAVEAVLASDPFSADHLPRERVITASGLLPWLDRLGLARRAECLRAEIGAAPMSSDPRRLALLSEETTADPALCGELSERLLPAGLCLLGIASPSPAPARIFASGPIDPSETSAWLDRLGGAACLLASRRYGMADDRIDLWHRAGIPIAAFDPAADLASCERTRLLIPIDADAREAAALVADWLS